MVACSGDTACADGVPCTSDVECEGGYCSANGCAPVGWVYAPAATYVMGAPLDERGRHSLRENGQHTVTLTRSFLVSRTTVTQGEWSALMGGTTPSMFTTCGADCPVVNITWFEMLAYANAMSARDGFDECYPLSGCTGTIGAGCSPGLDHCNGYTCDLAPLATPNLDCNGYRLPTESEWEYFARAGTTAPYATPTGTYDNWSPDVYDAAMDSAAWFMDNSAVTYVPSYDCSIWWPTAGPCGPHPVGLKAPNAWGLFDIAGNVYERVWDWSGDYPDPGSTVTDPTGPPSGTQKRMRGGAFNLWGQYLRIAYRTGPIPAAAYYDVGFRLVRTVP
ncbi:MAG: formylglycine-generating enzyme family protein [Sandaracinaceae bacterium]